MATVDVKGLIRYRGCTHVVNLSSNASKRQTLAYAISYVSIDHLAPYLEDQERRL